MAGLRPDNSWSTHWRPSIDSHARRQFQRVDGNAMSTERGGLNRGRGRGLAVHTHTHFHPPLASTSTTSTSGYHLDYSGGDVPIAKPIPAKKRRVEPQDLDDTFCQMDFDADDGYDVSPELTGDPREYVDNTGNVLEDGNGKRKRPVQNLVRNVCFFVSCKMY